MDTNYRKTASPPGKSGIFTSETAICKRKPQLVVAGARRVRLRMKDPGKLTYFVCTTQLSVDGDKSKTKATRQAINLTSFRSRHEKKFVNFKAYFFFQFYQKLFNNGNLSDGSDPYAGG